MPNHSSSHLESEIADLSSDDPARSLHPLRQEQIKQKLLQHIASIPQERPTFFQSIRQFIAHLTFLKFGFLTLALLILGSFTTMGVAYASKPGDMLYALKLQAEKLQIMLAVTEESKAELQSEFIESRIKEQEHIKNSVQPGSHDRDNRSRDNDFRPITQGIDNLKNIESKLQQKGNNNAAKNIHNNIERFKQRAAQLESKTLPVLNIENDGTTEKKSKPEDNKNRNKKVEQKPTGNVITNREAQSQTHTKIELPKNNVINVEIDTKSVISKDKLTN